MVALALLGIDFRGWELLAAMAIGATATLATMFLGRALFRKAPLPLLPPSRRESNAVVVDPFVHGSSTERRSSLRRCGNPIPILVTDEKVVLKPERGWVSDRSIGGLCVKVAQPFEAGSILNVKACNAPDTVPWVPIEVKACREDGGGFELGCQFVKTPNWNTLLLFG
jgi:hypothetical protein